jgi:NAD(P)-dependent dehydrogenase (short-subunit alcohol dehydrogenase family)
MSYFFGKYGVRINGIAPGNILFKNSTWEKKLKRQINKTRKFLSENVPLKKFGSTHDIAHLTAYLVSKKSEFITTVDAKLLKVKSTISRQIAAFKLFINGLLNQKQYKSYLLFA